MLSLIDSNVLDFGRFILGPSSRNTSVTPIETDFLSGSSSIDANLTVVSGSSGSSLMTELRFLLNQAGDAPRDDLCVLGDIDEREGDFDFDGALPDTEDPRFNPKSVDLTRELDLEVRPSTEVALEITDEAPAVVFAMKLLLLASDGVAGLDSLVFWCESDDNGGVLVRCFFFPMSDGEVTALGIRGGSLVPLSGSTGMVETSIPASRCISCIGTSFASFS